MTLKEDLETQGMWLFRYRGTIPLFIIVIGGILYLKTEISASLLIREAPYEFYFEMACMLISLIGLGMRVYTVGHTSKNTSGRNVKGQVAEQLNTTGIYAIVRHPLYVANLLMWLGPTFLTAHNWFILALCLFYWIYYERIMFAEEQFLLKKFGDEYTEYAKTVPAFVPKLSNFIKPKLLFSWKKVVQKEKNGLLAVFLVFLALDVAGELVTGKTNFNYVFIAGSILASMLYGVVKYLKKNTST